MRKVKKFMALGAAAVMAASMLAGCGGSGSAATEAQKENAAPVSAEAGINRGGENRFGIQSYQCRDSYLA